MGGQACVLYGAAEFSRDTDIAVLASAANLARLRRALDDLQARVIAVPAFQAKYLRRGHAVHFRCQDPQRPRRASWALYTSPMLPAPRSDTIS